jgi:hypothetical protein
MSSTAGLFVPCVAGIFLFELSIVYGAAYLLVAALKKKKEHFK